MTIISTHHKKIPVLMYNLSSFHALTDCNNIIYFTLLYGIRTCDSAEADEASLILTSYYFEKNDGFSLFLVVNQKMHFLNDCAVQNF
jgi:hypothetical protein